MDSLRSKKEEKRRTFSQRLHGEQADTVLLLDLLNNSYFGD